LSRSGRTALTIKARRPSLFFSPFFFFLFPPFFFSKHGENRGERATVMNTVSGRSPIFSLLFSFFFLFHRRHRIGETVEWTIGPIPNVTGTSRYGVSSPLFFFFFSSFLNAMMQVGIVAWTATSWTCSPPPPLPLFFWE